MKPHIKLRMDAGVGSSGLPRALTQNKGASWTNRDIASWMPRRGSPDADLLPDLPALVARSRDIERNNGVASGAIRTITDNVVGTGFRLVPRPNYIALGKDKAWADSWSQNTSSQWWSWAETTACHAADTMTFDQITTQVLGAQLLNGAGLVLPMWIPDRGDGYATKLQTIEIDRLSNPNLQMDTAVLRGGIELDIYGAPIAYNIRTVHPGDYYLGMASVNMWQWERIPRRTPFGRARVLHIFDPFRSAQSTGKPLFSSVLPEFKNVDRYTMAELQAAVLNAMIAAVIQTPMDQESIVGLFQNDADAYLAKRQECAVRLEAGAMLPLFPGDTMQPFIPGRPASAFGMFVENMFRIIGVAADLPYELLMKDFSKTNYSSARASMLEAWRSFLRRRDWLGTQFADPVYDLWLEERVNAGFIEAPDFYQNRAAYTRCKWVGPGRGWVDPMKEAMAGQIRIDMGVSTLEKECAEQGDDWLENMEQRAKELEKARELNIPQVVSGRATIVPEDASTDPGVATPGSAPAKPGGESYAFAYQMAVPGHDMAAFAARLARLEARMPKEAQR
jgi:lambda family phage portal protein